MQPIRTPRLAPYLVLNDPRAFLRFAEQGLGAQLAYEQADESGRIAHAELRLEDSIVMLGERPADRAAFPAMVHLYVRDADAAYRRALAAGATSVRAPDVAPDGDRRGGVRDRWGNEWWFTTLPPAP